MAELVYIHSGQAHNGVSDGLFPILEISTAGVAKMSPVWLDGKELKVQVRLSTVVTEQAFDIILKISTYV